MDFIRIGDDLFAWNADQWLEEFSEKYSKEIGLPFACYLRLDMVDDRLLSLLKKAGCYSVLVSIDSCSEYIREKILNRHWKSINIEENIKLIHTYGIKTWVNFMVAAPESTIKDDIESIYLSHRCHITYTGYCMTMPMKGTDLFNYCVQKGYLDSTFDGHVIDGSVMVNSPLKYISEKDQHIMKNIVSLGAIVSQLPWPFFYFGIFIIKHFKNRSIFYKINRWYMTYNREHVIFKIDKKKEKKNASRKNKSS
jgi:radical SAM superfamily enzyme YgiQ (UPF0313 family)